MDRSEAQCQQEAFSFAAWQSQLEVRRLPTDQRRVGAAGTVRSEDPNPAEGRIRLALSYGAALVLITATRSCFARYTSVRII